MHLGDTNERIRAVVSRPFRSFKKSPLSAVPADHFPEVGVIAFYKPPHICNAIELSPPARPTLQERALIGECFQTIRSWLNQIGEETILDSAGVGFLGLGISLYTGKGINNSGSVVESILVFERGYYGALFERRSRRQRK